MLDEGLMDCAKNIHPVKFEMAGGDRINCTSKAFWCSRCIRISIYVFCSSLCNCCTYPIEHTKTSPRNRPRNVRFRLLGRELLHFSQVSFSWYRKVLSDFNHLSHFECACAAYEIKGNKISAQPLSQHFSFDPVVRAQIFHQRALKYPCNLISGVN